uniref:Annexin A9 n=1 Tax=Chrysemys picta bellii TaxID=8478 RepID=A0A8C3FNM5_CHRPI
MLLGDRMDRRSLAQEILSQLPLAQQTAAWGTLGTIKPYLGFDAESDVQHLVKAIAGNDADHGAILDVLTNRTSAQSSDPSGALFQDLLKSMEAALSGNLERVIVGLLKPPAQYDAHELRAAMQVWPGDAAPPWEAGGVHVGATSRSTRSPSPLSSSFQALADPGARSEGAGERTWISIFTQRSPEHLSRVFGQYQKSHGLEVEETICKRFQGDGQVAMLALASVCRNTPRYFAEKLHNAMKGPGPDDKVLIRILISRSETDLLSIRSEFKKRHGKSLYSCLQVSMLRPPPPPPTQGQRQTQQQHALEPGGIEPLDQDPPPVVLTPRFPALPTRPHFPPSTRTRTQAAWLPAPC